MAKNKKMTKICLLSLLTLFGVTACGSSDVMAKPSDYDEQIIKSSGDDIYHNSKETIYDAIRNGELAEDVLNKLLYQYAISAFGRYNNYIPKLAGGTDDVNITLKAAAADIENNPSNPTVAKKFIEAHEAYWSKDSDGNRVNDGRELARVSAKWETIEKRIMERMYGDIDSSSFKYRNKFDEKRYLESLTKDLKNVVSYTKASEVHAPQIINPDVDKYDLFDGAIGFLKRDYYQSNYSLNSVEDSSKVESYDATYVEDEIVPTIYRTLLTEQYLFEETYNTLGRSYAREVNIISLTKDSKYPTSAEYLMKEFVGDKVISAKPDAESIKDSTNKIGIDEFNMISNIFKGVDLDKAEGVAKDIRDSLVESKAIEPDDETDPTYYKGTEYGKMMEDYSKIKDDPVLTDTSIESEFTGNGAYPISVGKEIKTDDVRLKNHVTKGWYIKGGKLSVSDSISNRLFSVGVAAALNSDDSHDRFYFEDGAWKYDSSRDVNKYVARINGSYFLKVESTEAHDGTDPVASAQDILFSDGGSYYVVQILEAANTTKLSKTNKGNYANIYSDEVMEEYVNEIAKVISSGDTYETLAKKYWLSKMDIVYHDTVIYDYFKENFPELFD